MSAVEIGLSASQSLEGATILSYEKKIAEKVHLSAESNLF
jgi:hypothetical protein